MEEKKKTLIDTFKITIVGFEKDPIKGEKFKASLEKYLENQIMNERKKDESD